MIVMMRESSVKEVILPVESLDCMSDIPLDLVVTITRDGKPLSRFADDVWDYSATSVSQKTLNFRGKIESILLRNGSAIDNLDILNKAITQFKGLILHWVNAIGGCSISKLNGDTTALGYLVAHSLVVEHIFCLILLKVKLVIDLFNTKILFVRSFKNLSKKSL